MEVEHSMAEYHASIHLYGHLLSLATRPFSKGNDIAIHEAINEIKSCTNYITERGNYLVPEKLTNTIEYLFGMSDIIPAQNLAQIAIGSFNKVLRNLLYPPDLWQQVSENGHKFNRDIDKIVISVGPTIGLGDELILANALLMKAQQSRISVYVETRRFELWNYHKYPSTFIGLPPSGSMEYLSKLDENSLSKTGFIFADFLTSDPTPVPKFVYDTLSFTGRWIFGNATAKLADKHTQKVYIYEYPTGLPLSRKMQCDWIASRLLPSSDTLEHFNLKPKRLSSEVSKRSILLQILTSKPELLLPADFYCACFKKLREYDGRFSVKILSGPNESTKKITESIQDALQDVLPSSMVSICNSKKLNSVMDLIQEADLLFGPDTFTAHIAAHLYIPQVTLYLQQHHGWVNAASQSFFLSYTNSNSEILSNSAAKRIAFILGLDNARYDKSFFHFAQSWKNAFNRLEVFLQNYFYNNICANHIDIKNVIKDIEAVLSCSDKILNSTIGENAIDNFHKQLIIEIKNLLDNNSEKVMHKIAYLYHILGSNDLSGVLFNLAMVCDHNLNEAGYE